MTPAAAGMNDQPIGVTGTGGAVAQTANRLHFQSHVGVSKNQWPEYGAQIVGLLLQGHPRNDGHIDGRHSLFNSPQGQVVSAVSKINAILQDLAPILACDLMMSRIWGSHPKRLDLVLLLKRHKCTSSCLPRQIEADYSPLTSGTGPAHRDQRTGGLPP